MKRFLAVLIIVALVIGAVFGANNQKIYSVDTDLYKTISQIYVLTGHALPSSTGPWSADELLKMYENIDRSDVPSFMLGKYDAALEELDKSASIEFKGGAMEFDGTLNLELYVHTYDTQAADAYSQTDVNGLTEHAFEGRSWWYGKDLNHITPFFQLEWETWLTDHFYTAFDLGLQNAFRGDAGGELGSTVFNTNIPMLQNLKFQIGVLDIASFPHRAFAALGGDGWSFEAGRDRLNWGAGTTGNVILSDNLPYHDMARFTAYGEKFKYTYMVSFFPSKKNYYNTDAIVGYTGTGHNNSTQTLDGLFFLSTHRFEFRMFKDKVSFVLTEGLVYVSENNNVQFAALSPMFFMHNAFMPNNSNSTLALELNWTPLRGITLYGQFLFDQFTMPGFEDPAGPGHSYASSPNGNAYLAGAKFITGVKDGVLTINPEIAYVSPFCYLRDGYNSDYGMDYTGAIRSRLYAYENRGLGTDILYEDYVLGYKYGPDCLVANLSASWEGEKLNIRANGLFIAHGTVDLWTKWTKIPANTTEEDFNAGYSGVTTSHVSDNYRYPDAKTTRNARWYTLDIGLGADYQLLDNLSLSLDVDYVYMRNIFNVGGQNGSDIQIIFGARYDLF